jgi:small subunit ribosomal protein S16
MKRLGRANRPFYRVVAVDSRCARDGRVLEYLGHYDPMVPETDARAQLNGERIDYWLSVGAQPSDKVRVLIKKYGSNGTHLSQRQAALDRLKNRRQAVPAPVPKATKKQRKSQGESPAGESQPEAVQAGSENPSLEPAAQEG